MLAGLFLCYARASTFADKLPSSPGNTLPATALHPFGRYIYNEEHQLELIGSAVHFGFRFLGKECQVDAFINDANGHNYLQYVLDGVYQKKIRIEGNARRPLIIEAGSAGMHTVWVYKATEATTGPIFIEKIIGQRLQALTEPKAALIEFIGNSITCGAAADASEVPCAVGEYHDHHNAYYSYGPRIARDLHINFMLSSVSGIGIYRSWNTDGPSMPQVYERAGLRSDDPRPWDFARYRPAVVSIALGTNDFSIGDGKHPRQPFDSAIFVTRYIGFVRTVKSKYPASRIALLSSPMIGGEGRFLLERCLAAVKRTIDDMYPSDKRVAIYFFKPMHARGCAGHPSVEDHAILAGELIPFFRSLLK